jgi:hypothetical protein
LKGATTFSITTLWKTTLSLAVKNVTLNTSKFQLFSVVMLHAVMPSVAFFATLNVVMLNVAMQSVVAPFKVQVQEKQNGAINFKKLSLHLQGPVSLNFLQQ